VDAAHADQQLNQFSIAQAQVGYADRILLTKTDVAPDCEALIQRLQQMNARAPVYKVTHGDIDLGVLFDIEGFVLNDKLTLTPPVPLFRRIPQAQNNIGSIVVYHDQPLELMQISEVMEGLLLEYADSLLRYKGILSIKDEPRRLLFQGVQRLYNADWDREWLADEERRSTLVFIGVDLPEEVIRARFTALDK
jgi:G3E family GTPase